MFHFVTARAKYLVSVDSCEILCFLKNIFSTYKPMHTLFPSHLLFDDRPCWRLKFWTIDQRIRANSQHRPMRVSAWPFMSQLQDTTLILSKSFISDFRCKSGTASMMCKRAQHDVPHIVLTFSSEEEQVVFILRRHHFHHARRSEASQNASDFTIRTLLMRSSHIFSLDVQCVSELPSGCPETFTLLGNMWESSVHCPHRCNFIICPLIPSKTRTLWPSCFLQISYI